MDSRAGESCDGKRAFQQVSAVLPHLDGDPWLEAWVCLQHRALHLGHPPLARSYVTWRAACDAVREVHAKQKRPRAVMIWRDRGTGRWRVNWRGSSVAPGRATPVPPALPRAGGRARGGVSRNLTKAQRQARVRAAGAHLCPECLHRGLALGLLPNELVCPECRSSWPFTAEFGTEESGTGLRTVATIRLAR